MKKILILIMICMFLIPIAFADTLPIYVRPKEGEMLQPSTEFLYEFNFTSDYLCSNVLLEFNETIVTDDYGIGFVELDISNLTSNPSYLCEYRDEVLRKVHNISTGLFVKIRATNNTIIDGNLTIGQKITFKLGEIIDNILDGWIKITGHLNVTGNQTNDGYIHLLPNDTSYLSTVSGLGDLYVGGESRFQDGITVLAEEFGQGIVVYGSNESEIIIRSSTTGVFTGSNNYLCDASTGFTQSDIDNNYHVFFEDSIREVVSDIDILVNASCIKLMISTNNIVPDMNPVTYYVKKQPTFMTYDGGHVYVGVGEYNASYFSVSIPRGKAFYGMRVEDVAARDQHESFSIKTDVQTYDGVIPFNSYLYSSNGTADKHIDSFGIQIDASGINNSELHFLDLSIISPGQGNEIDAIKVSPNVSHIIHMGSSDTLNSSYYDDTATTVNVTANFTNNASDVTLFENDNSYIYLGSDVNFTKIKISLNIGASKTIGPLFYYCNSSGWFNLTGELDTTNGFKKSGAISFINPTDRGSCYQEFDGTNFTDLTNYSYIAIKRTSSSLVVKPVESVFRVSGGQTKFVLQDDMIRLNPVSAPPEICDSEFEGAIYSDIDLSLPCFCDGTNWLQFDDFSTTCS